MVLSSVYVRSAHDLGIDNLTLRCNISMRDRRKFTTYKYEKLPEVSNLLDSTILALRNFSDSFPLRCR